MPSTPSSVVGRAGHVALQHFYGGMGHDASVALGLEYVRSVSDFEIEFGVAKTKEEMEGKRLSMEHEYHQAISFYLARPPKYHVLGIEVAALAKVAGLPLPIKAISDLVVESRGHNGCVDIVDHKFVDSWSALGADKPLFILQAIFNYYTIGSEFKRPVKRFILQECKKRKNKDGSSQMRKYVIEYDACADEFEVFHRLVADASKEILTRKTYLPNPSDMFDGKNSYEIYRMRL